MKLGNAGQTQGQLDVGGLVALLIFVAVGAMVVFEVTDVVKDDGESGRTSVTSQLLNTDFTDNTTQIPDSWDNSTVGTFDTENAHTFLENQWALIRFTDNGNNSGVDRAPDNENGWYYQSLVVGSLMDGISSATVSFQYRLIENENLLGGTEVLIDAILGLPSGENLAVFNTGENAISGTWTSVENSVLDNITGAGTYTLYIRASATPDNTVETSKITVGFDNANFNIGMYSKGYVENITENLGDKSDTVFNLLTILAIVIVASLIIGVVIRSIGGIGGVSTGRGGGTPPPATPPAPAPEEYKPAL